MHIRSFIALVSIVLLFSQSFSVFAISVFQWVDSEGITHFSDKTPAEGKVVKQLNHYEIDGNYPQGRNPEEDYFSIINQWKRTNDEREARLKLIQENKQASQFVPPQPQPRFTFQPSQRYYTGLFPPLYLHNRGRGHHRGHFLHQPVKQPMIQPQPARGYVGNVAATGVK